MNEVQDFINACCVSNACVSIAYQTLAYQLRIKRLRINCVSNACVSMVYQTLAYQWSPRQKQLEMLLLKSGWTLLTKNKTLPLRQNIEGTLLNNYKYNDFQFSELFFDFPVTGAWFVWRQNSNQTIHKKWMNVFDAVFIFDCNLNPHKWQITVLALKQPSLDAIWKVDFWWFLLFVEYDEAKNQFN